MVKAVSYILSNGT